MFSRLIESKRVRTRRTGGAVMSVVMHGALVGGAVLATVSPGPAASPIIDVFETPRVQYIPVPAPREPHDSRPQNPSRPVCDCLPILERTTIELPPIGVPLTLPPIDDGKPPRGDIAFGPYASIGGNGILGADPGSLHESGEALRAGSVDRVAFLLSDVRPRYPDALRTAGVGGRVLVRFVVDTTGRVERESVRVLEASHAGFENAVRDVLPRLRFRPAEVGARRVRMLVEMPFEFTLTNR